MNELLSHSKLFSIFSGIDEVYGFKPKNAPSSNLTADSGDGTNHTSSVQRIDELIEKGDNYYDEGKYEEAITWYDKALAVDPNYKSALNGKGVALDDLGKYEEAITWYDKALAVDPNYKSALYNKGNALDDLGKYEEAITWYDKYLAIDPKDVDTLNGKGVALDNLGKYEEAITWYDKALAVDPNYKSALYNKGNALDDLGKYEEAITWYDKALAVDPNYKSALNGKGDVLDDLGKSEEAITWYDKALAIDPKDVDTLNEKGVALENLGKYEEAITWYDKALAVDPNYSYAKNNKEEALSKLDDESFDETSTSEEDTNQPPVVKNSKVIDFSGVNYADVVNSRDINLNSFTVSIWFNTAINIVSGNNGAFLLNKGGIGNDRPGYNLNYGLFLTDENKVSGGFETLTGEHYYVTSSSAYNDGKWHNAILTFDEKLYMLKLYMDGIETSSNPTKVGVKPDNTGNQPIRLGANSLVEKGKITGNYTGQLDDIQVWDYAFTKEQVSGLFDRESKIDR